MHNKIEWFDVSNPPVRQVRVLVMATNSSYQFGHPQMFAGFFVDKYYDTPINEFKLTGVKKDVWTPVKWAYAPMTP